MDGEILRAPPSARKPANFSNRATSFESVMIPFAADRGLGDLPVLEWPQAICLGQMTSITITLR